MLVGSGRWDTIAKAILVYTKYFLNHRFTDLMLSPSLVDQAIMKASTEEYNKFTTERMLQAKIPTLVCDGEYLGVNLFPGFLLYILTMAISGLRVRKGTEAPTLSFDYMERKLNGAQFLYPPYGLRTIARHVLGTNQTGADVAKPNSDELHALRVVCVALDEVTQNRSKNEKIQTIAQFANFVRNCADVTVTKV